MLDEARRLLGTTPMGLRNARLDGTLRTHHVAASPAAAANRVPIVYTTAARPVRQRPRQPRPGLALDRDHLVTRIPPDLCQTLMRIIHYSRHVGRHRYDANAIRRLDAPRRRARSRRLPPPSPILRLVQVVAPRDYFLGDDPTNWRKSPQRPRRPPAALSPQDAEAKATPRPADFHGSLHFNGHQWLCPICNDLPHDLSPAAADQSPRATSRAWRRSSTSPHRHGFACSPLPPRAILHAAARRSLEPVDRLPDRRPALRPRGPAARVVHHRPQASLQTRPEPRPALRREQVRQRLLQGETRAAIATELRITPGAVTHHANRIYKSERVRGQTRLAGQIQPPPPRRASSSAPTASSAPCKPANPRHQSPTTLDIQLARSSATSATSAALAGSPRVNQALRRRRPPRRRPRPPPNRRALNMTPQSVSTRLCELRRAGRLPPLRLRCHDFRANVH